MDLDVSSLGELLRKERASPSLQPVGGSFHDELVGLLKEVEEKFPPYSRERQNLKNLVMDIFSSREKKLVFFAISYARSGEELDVDNATQEEKEFLISLIGILRERRRGLFGKKEKKAKGGVSDRSVNSGKSNNENTSEDEEDDQERLVTLRILEELPPIVGSDGKTHGSFKPEDIVALPERNAKIFLKHGYGEKIVFG
jgi:DNA replication initiation complex subunit (GINS family)